MGEIAKPGTTKSAKDIEIREKWALRYMKSNPNTSRKETAQAVVDTFGIGIGTPALRRLGKIAGLKGAGLDFEEVIALNTHGFDGKGKTKKDLCIRIHWIMDYFRQEPRASNRDINNKCVELFGMKVSSYTIADARAYVDAERRKSLRKPRYVEHTKPEPKPEQLSLPELPSRTTAEEAIGTLVKMLIDELPTLESLRVSVKDGKVDVDFNLKVVETRKGKLSL